MEEHKLLTGMLLAALVISVGGTFIAMDSLGGITGAATGTGTGSATVSADISIDVSDASINLGAGTVDPGADYAIVYSDPFNNTINGSWGNSTNDFLNVTNIGNTRINLTVESTNSSGNGSRGFACQGQTCATEFGEYEGTSLILAAIGQGSTCEGNGVNIPSGFGSSLDIYFDVADQEYVVCECMNYDRTNGNNNEINFYMAAGIPDDAPAGTPSTTFTFTSYEPDAGFC